MNIVEKVEKNYESSHKSDIFTPVDINLHMRLVNNLQDLSTANVKGI